MLLTCLWKTHIVIKISLFQLEQHFLKFLTDYLKLLLLISMGGGLGNVYKTVRNYLKTSEMYFKETLI